MPSSTLNQIDNTPVKRSFKPIMAMILLFGAPYLFSWYFFFSGDTVSISSPTNKGILISPIKALPQVTLTQLSGEQFNTAELAGFWTMITVTSNCEQQCAEALFSMQQSRKAMAVKRKFIKRVLLVNDALDIQAIQTAVAPFKGTHTVIGPDNSINQLLSSLDGLAPKMENTIYLVDPKLNLMMAYTDDMSGTFLLKDLERLFKIIQMDD